MDDHPLVPGAQLAVQTPGGGQFQVSAQQSNGLNRIAFTDSGVGMNTEVMDHLFEPFFSTKTNGSGLGLAVSHEIVTQHQGALEVSSQPDRGSTFVVKLPVYEQDKT